jgi:hypothetical protein
MERKTPSGRVARTNLYTADWAGGSDGTAATMKIDFHHNDGARHPRRQAARPAPVACEPS